MISGSVRSSNQVPKVSMIRRYFRRWVRWCSGTGRTPVHQQSAPHELSHCGIFELFRCLAKAFDSLLDVELSKGSADDKRPVIAVQSWGAAESDIARRSLLQSTSFTRSFTPCWTSWRHSWTPETGDY